MLLAELAARLKAEGKTLHQQLDELFLRYGCHSEGQINVQMPGEKGMDDMQALMAKFRSRPPQSLGGHEGRARSATTSTAPSPQPGGPRRSRLAGPRGDMVILDLEAEGNYVAVRPSGTEPKVKFYIFAYDPPEKSADLAAVKQRQADRLKTMGEDLRRFSGV